MLRLVHRTTEAPGTKDQLQQQEEDTIFNRALDAGLQGPEDYVLIGLARLDSLRRQQASSVKDKAALLERIRTICTTVNSTIQEKFSGWYDPLFQLPEYSALLEVKLSSSKEGENDGAEAGKKVWEDALNGAAAKCATGWLKYIEFLKYNLPSGGAGGGSGGDTDNAVVTAVFKRCYAREMEGYGQIEVCNAWVKFEREHGGAEGYFNAWKVVEPIIAEATAQATAAAMQAQAGTNDAAAAVEAKPVLSKEESKALRQQNDPNFLKKKRKMEEEKHRNDGRGGGGGGGGAKRSRTERAPEKTDAAPITTTTAPLPTNAADTTIEAKETREDAKDKAPFKDFAARRALTAFVKHLPEDTTEDSLRALFSPCGTINYIKIGIDHATGRQKGFAYVEFDTADGLEAACRVNGIVVGEKTLFVAPSNPPADGPGGGGGRGGRGGGRGGGDRGGGRGGRGRGGIGYSGGGRGGGGGQVAKATQRGHLDIAGAGGDGGGTTAGTGGDFKPVVGFVPRAAAVQKPFAQSGGSGAGGGGEQPKSNSDFRKMLLEKKS
jgi:hypothetical protein